MKSEDVINVKVGDSVRVKADEYYINGDPIPESILLVVENDTVDDETKGYRINHHKVELALIYDFPKDFEKVADSYFSGGLVNTANFGLMGEACSDFAVTIDVTNDGKPYVSGIGLGSIGETGNERIIPLTRDKTDLGVYRPVLEDRKVGKVRVELVDDGFPLALREIAKVMTWAQTAKGYKDHDWQNLPNAEVSLAGAASRHRTDHIMQRVFEGLNINQCVDHESKLLHKAHEAFGVLAQLELMLRGKFE